MILKIAIRGTKSSLTLNCPASPNQSKCKIWCQFRQWFNIHTIKRPSMPLQASTWAIQRLRSLLILLQHGKVSSHKPFQHQFQRLPRNIPIPPSLVLRLLRLQFKLHFPLPVAVQYRLLYLMYGLRPKTALNQWRTLPLKCPGKPIYLTFLFSFYSTMFLVWCI